MNKMELAPHVGISAATVDRAQRGKFYRMETNRIKILALGLTLQEKQLIF